MKTFILCIALFFTIIAAFAQDAKPYTSSIKVRFGGAFPTGDFDSESFDKVFPPMAMSGPMLQVNYLRNIKKNLSAGATFALRRNPVNLDAFATESDELVISRESEPWQSVFTMADLQYQLQTLTRVFYVRGSLGSAFNRKASIKVNTTYGLIDLPPVNSTALAYGLHIGITEHFNRLGIGFETGILSTKPTFKVQDAQGRTTTFSQEMTTINVSMSLSYDF